MECSPRCWGFTTYQMGGHGQHRSNPEPPVTHLESGPVTVPISEGRCEDGVQEEGEAGPACVMVPPAPPQSPPDPSEQESEKQ